MVETGRAADCCGDLTAPLYGYGGYRVPWMGAVEWNAAVPCPTHQTIGLVLLRLLVGVVAELAQALKVRRVKEDHLIPTMRPDVIRNTSSNHSAQLHMQPAQRLTLQLRTPHRLPAGGIVQVVMIASWHGSQSKAPDQFITVGRGGCVSAEVPVTQSA